MMAASTLASINPATGETLGTVPVAGARRVAQAISDVRSVQAHWPQVSLDERVQIARRFARILLARRDDMALTISREAGKPLAEAMLADVLPSLDYARFLATDARALLTPRRRRFRNPLLVGHRSEVQHRPMGVVAAITPWNYPLAIPVAAVLPAIVAGNGVVLKPSEETPLVANQLLSLLHEAGMPEGLVEVVQGAGPAGAAVAGGDVDGILFTGSVPTGQKVAAAASRRLVPCCLELGGKDPAIVLKNANRERVASGILWAAMTNAGQTCASVERAFVPAADHDSLVKAWVEGARQLRLGEGESGAVDMGPVINDAAVKRIIDHVRDAERHGATVVAGGAVRDDLGPRFVEPTVLTNVATDMRCMREETFGPTLPVMAYDAPDDAVAWANDSPFGLTASVWGPGGGRKGIATRDIAARLDAGTVTINDHIYTYGATETPWGGVKASGLGSSHGAAGLLELTRLRHTATAPARGRDAWWYPYDRDVDVVLAKGLPWLYGRRGLRGAALLPALRRRTRPGGPGR